MAKKSKSEERMERMRHHVLVCSGPDCTKASSEDVLTTIRKCVKNANLDDTVRITVTDCMLRCSQSPTVVVYPDGVWYQKMTPEAVEQVVENHLIGGEIYGDKAQYRWEGKKVEDCRKRKPKNLGHRNVT